MKYYYLCKQYTYMLWHVLYPPCLHVTVTKCYVIVTQTKEKPSESNGYTCVSQYSRDLS